MKRTPSLEMTLGAFFLSLSLLVMLCTGVKKDGEDPWMSDLHPPRLCLLSPPFLDTSSLPLSPASPDEYQTKAAELPFSEAPLSHSIMNPEGIPRDVAHEEMAYLAATSYEASKIPNSPIENLDQVASANTIPTGDAKIIQEAEASVEELPAEEPGEDRGDLCFAEPEEICVARGASDQEQDQSRDSLPAGLTAESSCCEALYEEQPADDHLLRVVEGAKDPRQDTPEPKGAPIGSEKEEIQRQLERVAVEIGVDPRLARAMAAVESGYDHKAVSPLGAIGVLQLMPRFFCTDNEVTPEMLFDPHINIRVGLTHMKALLVKFNENLDLSLAAYNAGARRVIEAGHAVPPIEQTQNYVRKVKEAMDKEDPDGSSLTQS